MKYFSMFTGIGGFEYGIEQTNDNQPKNEGYETKTDSECDNIKQLQGATTCFECVGFSEINKYSISVFRKHYPAIKNFGDATKINPTELPEFDMLCGGFPCQSFSIAGKRAGFDDTRGTLFFEIARIAKTKKPKYLFLENVKGLLNHDKGQTFATIIQTLADLGYESQWMVLNSKFFGVPQNRERIFIIANLRGKPRPEILHFRETNEPDTNQNKELQMQVSNTLRSNYSNGYSNETYVAQRVGDFRNDEGLRVRENDVSPCLATRKHSETDISTMAPLLIAKAAKNIKRLTPIECERLQGFPDNWTKLGVNDNNEIVEISDSQRYKMIGNAVTTKVITAIMEALSKK